MRFVIWAPNYNDRSAGGAALHRLCHWLTILGHDASLTCDGLNPEWETKFFEHRMTDDTIAVYPEIISGNPLNARRVARWALSHPGFHYFGSPVPMDAADAVFCYADRFRAATEKAAPGKTVHRLFVSVYPSDMFYASAQPKQHDMYYVGRGGNCWDAFRDRVDLSRAIPFAGNYQNRYEVGKALRKVERFFCFDQVCALLLESMMCGARAFQIEETGAVVEIGPSGIETMNGFEDGNRFDQPGDVEALVRAFE